MSEIKMIEFGAEKLITSNSMLDTMSTYGYQTIVVPLMDKLGSITHIPDVAGASSIIELFFKENMIFKNMILEACEELCKHDPREMDEEDSLRYIQVLTRLRNILLNISDVYIKLRRFSGVCGDIETMCYEYTRVLNIKLGVEM